MSTSKYSGIAVAAANRAALARQEAEQERLDSGRRVDAKAEALLAHLRATMTTSALLGVDTARARTAQEAGETSGARRRDADEDAGARSTTTSKNPKKRAHGDGRGGYEGSDDARDDQNIQRAPVVAKEKTYLSKAERKRLKKRSRADDARTVAPGTGATTKKTKH